MKLDIGQDVLLELPERANLVGGLKIEHKFSQPDVHPYDLVEWERRNIAIFDFKKGVNAYERNNVEVPKFWDQNAAQTTISKYLFGNAVDTPEYEDSLKHAFDRISNTYTVWGWKHGYFLDTDSAKAFNWELKAMLVNQMWAPNSPVWFNIGHWEQWRWGRPDLRQKLGGNKSFKAVLKEDGELEVRELSNAFNHPQASACFLTGVEDSMESILQHQVAEGRIFTSGSGVGINLSTLRSSHEPISGKGKSSGPLSFDKGWDKMAGAIKSGGKCLAPWQQIYTEQGPVAVKDLAAQGGHFVCLSYDPTNKRIMAKPAQAWMAEVKKVVEIITDKGIFALSEDHPVRTADHQIIKAGKLRKGMHLHAGTIDLSTGYLRVHLQNGKKGKKHLHQMIASDFLGESMQGKHVHHKDGDKLNNCLTNLEILTAREHHQLHNRETVNSGQHVFQTRKFPKRGAANPMHRTAQFWGTKEAKAYRKLQEELLKRSGRATAMQAESTKQRMLNKLWETSNSGGDISSFETYYHSRRKLLGKIDSKKRLEADIRKNFGSFSGMLQEMNAKNHTVVSIRSLGIMETYDVEVSCPSPDDKTCASGHNFLLWSNTNSGKTGSGIFVLNTRRAARMVLMDSNHPDIMEFVNLKNEQEQIAKIVLREHNTQVALSGIAQEKLEKGTVAEKLAAQFILSQPVVNKREYSGAMDGEIYGETVSNQNANHSVSLLGDFWDAYANNGNYSTRWVTQPDKIAATFKAEELLKAMAQSVYDNAEPGCHNNDWINLWSPYKSEERLTTSNPCITGDSLVAGQGLAPIQDLVGKTPRVKGLDGKLHKAAKVFKTGTKQVYRLTTKFGYHLDITKDHKIPVVSIETVDGERVLRSHLDIPVAQLRKGDFVHLQGANPGTKKISIELGRLAGFAAACGYVLTDGSIALNFGTAHEAAKEARKIINTITDADAKLVKIRDKFSLALKDRKILKQLGTLLTLTPGAAPQLADGARSLATRELGDMLSAIFDVSANVEKNKIVLKNKAELVSQVQILLLTFGIKAKVLKNRLELKSNNSYLFSRTIRFDAPSKRKAANTLKPINLIEASIHQKLDDLPNLDQVESVTLLGNEEVYDLTEPVTSHFVANGIVIHNCSEYLAPINTSCNLSSFNAYRFLDRETKEIKTDLLEHGALLAMLVADLNVEEGGFPVPEIARATYQYRTTGIGFGNIGGLLMSLGIPYDSDEGRWLAGTLTSFLTAACWKASYKMGNEYGAYLKYETNKNDLTKVLDLHIASDSLLSKLPHINKEKAEEIISRGPNSTLPSWGSLSGRSGLRALVESFDLSAPWDEVMIKTTRKLSAATTNLWRDVKKEMKSGQPRNSFVSLYAPGGCLAADSMVLTSRGLKRLYRLGNPQGGQWQPINESVQTNEGPQQATKFYLNGRAPTRIVRTTRLHEIQGTGNHRVKRLNPDTLQLEWVHLKDATPGQILATRLGGMFGEKQTVWLPKLPTLHNNNKDGVHVPETMTKELAEFIGLFSGDGSLHSRSVRIACALRDKDLIKYILDLGQRLFGIKGKVNPKKEGQQSVSVDFYSQPLSAWMAACGFQKHPNREGKKSKKPFIPDLVLDTNDPYVYGAYLRGLAEADGTLKYNGLPTIATHHRPFAQDIMNLMTVLGIAAAMDDCTTSGHSGKTLYRVRLRNHDYLPAWEKYVGFLSNRKKDLQDNQVNRSFTRNDLIPINPNWLTKATQAMRNTSRLHHGIRKGQITKNTAKQIIKLEGNSVLGKRLKVLLDYTFDAVLENLDGGVTNTYDLSVPSNVTYLANGFVSHNTISAPLGIYDEGTTSAEPDYTLVKYKVLAGGGMLRMFNRLALEGLRTIGYSEWHVKEAALEVAGLNGLYVACQADADAVTRHLVMPTMDKPGPVREAYSQLDPNSPSYLEPSEMVRRVTSGKSEGIADLILNGKGHVENIPWLPTHHMAIFDCAATSSDGKRAIEPLGHIKMLGSLQPFISGAVSKCITGDSIVTTSKGLQRVGGLYNGEKPDTFSKVDFTVPGPNKPEQATNFYYGGTKSVWEVELEDGRKIKGTRVHRLRTAGENGLDWTQTPDLSPGDWVALQLGAEMWGPEKLPSNVPLDASYGSQNMFREPSQKQITDVCLFLGMLTADGHLTRSNYVVGLTKNEPQVLNKFQSLLKSLFGLQARAVTDARNGVTSIQIGSKSLQQWLDGVGFSKENIPDWILGGSRRMALAYLSGLFLDGWISQTGDIAISQRHQSLTRDVQAIFDNLGISTYFSDNVVNEVNYPVLHVLGKDRKKAARTLTWIEAKKRTRAKSVKAAEDREIFPLHRKALKEAIRAKKKTSDFREVFDPRTKYIQTSTFLKAAKAVGFNFDKEALSYRYVRVSGVRYAGEQEVFDLSVPSTEQFVANGIVNHNTVNLPYYATTDEILDCFVKSHKMGVKCIALYRADSKGVSVYQSSSPESQRWTTDQVWKTITSSIQEQADEIVQKASVPKRRKLHDRRWSQVVKFGIAGQGNLEGYLIVGVYPDGTCGEVFGKLGQGGSFAHGMFESFCKAFSVMLQWGVPFQQATSTFRSMAFDPSGFVKVGDPDSEHGRADIKSCKSVIDLVMQILKWMFPEENNYRIKSLQSSKLELGAAAVEISNATPTSSQTTPVSGNSNAVVDLSSAETCPECGSLSVIQDGRCRKCTHCGYSSGGCS